MNKRIVLSGIDGSGKSTHARRLRFVAHQQGVSIKIIWARRYVLSLPVLALCRFLGITNVYKNKNGYRVSEYPFYKYAPLRLLWPWIQFLDWVLFCSYLKIRSLFSTEIFLFDRYTIDAFVDIVADVRKPFGFNILEKLFLVSLTKNLTVVVLDIDEYASINRKKDVSSYNYLSSRRKIYKELAEKFQWSVVSTSEPFSVVQSAIFDVVVKQGLFS